MHIDTSWKRAADAAMDRYADGDDAAFGELYDLVAPRLHAFFARRTAGDGARAEDLLQQTFLQMHAARRHFTRGAEVMPWAFAIARRLLIDGVRLAAREQPLDDETEERLEARGSHAEQPDLAAEAAELAVRCAATFATLPAHQRAAFELTRGEGLSVRDAALRLGTTVTAIKLRVHRTYEALRVVAV